MTRIYSLDGEANLHGPGQWSGDLLPQSQLEYSDYWSRMGRWNVPKDELIQDLGNGCQLLRHGAVTVPDLAIAKMQIKFRQGPEELQDIMPAGHDMHVSETARDVIEAVDPGAHQFFPVPFLDKNGDPWTNQTFFAMIDGPLVRTPTRSKARMFEQRQPHVTGQLQSPDLSLLNAAEGRQILLQQFPIWRIPYGADLCWNQGVIDAFHAAGLKGVDLIEPGMTEGEGRTVNIIDMN